MIIHDFAWPTVPLSKVCKVSIGKTPSRSEPRYWGPGYPWVSIGDMNGRRYLKDTAETITTAAVEECNCKPIEAGTLLMSFKLSIGKLAIAERRLFTNEAIASLPILDPNQLSTEFLYYALQVTDLMSE